jgi:hypothetical protein
VQATDQGKGIQMQRRAALRLHPVVCWRRDGNRGRARSQNYGLTSLARVQAASRDQPTPSLALCNALFCPEIRKKNLRSLACLPVFWSRYDSGRRGTPHCVVCSWWEHSWW